MVLFQRLSDFASAALGIRHNLLAESIRIAHIVMILNYVHCQTPLLSHSYMHMNRSNDNTTCIKHAHEDTHDKSLLLHKVDGYIS